jgi:hypothetical protein
LRAERRTGQLLKQIPRQQRGDNGRHKATSETPTLPSLEDMGITRDQSSQ